MPEDLKKDFKKLGQLLQDLIEKSRYCWNNERNLNEEKLPKEAIDAYKDLLLSRVPVRKEELQDLVYGGTDFRYRTVEPEIILLPPLKSDSKMVPILLLDVDFREPTSDKWIGIKMYRKLDSGDTVGLYFRFESPEEGPPHNYWHIQMGDSEKVPEWLPETEPCIPIFLPDEAANNPVSIAIYALTCLYSKSTFHGKIFPEAEGKNPEERYITSFKTHSVL